MAKPLKFFDEETGSTIEIPWDGPGTPSDDDIQKIKDLQKSKALVDQPDIGKTLSKAAGIEDATPWYKKTFDNLTGAAQDLSDSFWGGKEIDSNAGSAGKAVHDLMIDAPAQLAGTVVKRFNRLDIPGLYKDLVGDPANAQFKEASDPKLSPVERTGHLLAGSIPGLNLVAPGVEYQANGQDPDTQHGRVLVNAAAALMGGKDLAGKMELPNLREVPKVELSDIEKLPDSPYRRDVLLNDLKNDDAIKQRDMKSELLPGSDEITIDDMKRQLYNSDRMPLDRGNGTQPTDGAPVIQGPWTVSPTTMPEISEPSFLDRLKGYLPDNSPSSQRGAIGDSTALNKFEDSQFKKYGAGWREAQSPEEAAFHQKLLEGNKDVSFTEAKPGQSAFDPIADLKNDFPEVDVPAAVEAVRSQLPPEAPLVTDGTVNPDALKAMIQKVQRKTGVPQMRRGSDIGNLADAIGKEIDAKNSAPEVSIPSDPNTPVDVTNSIKVGKKPVWADQSGNAPIDVTDQIKAPRAKKAAAPAEDIEVFDPSQENGFTKDEIDSLKNQIRTTDQIDRAQATEMRSAPDAQESLNQELLRKADEANTLEAKNIREQRQAARQNQKEGLAEVEGRVKADTDLERQKVELTDKISREQQKEEIANQKAAMERTVKNPSEKSLAADLMDLPKTLRSSVDISAPGRQGLFLLNRPEALRAMLRGAKSGIEKYHLDVVRDLETRPNAELYKKAGLEQLKPQEGVTDEFFPSQLAEKIPGVRQSEHIFTDQGNLMRADMFDKWTEQFSKVGKTPDTAPELYQGMARYLNTLTGRTPLPESLRGASTLLNRLFWSPRFLASRVQLLNPKFYYDLPREMQVAALRDVGGTIAVGTGLIAGTAALLKAGGHDASVELDPRHSDFGKLRVGKTSYDFSAGLVPLIRTTARLASGEMKTRSGTYRYPGRNETSGLPETRFKKTMLDEALNFTGNKMAPAVTVPYNLMTGRGYMGEKYGLPEAARDVLAPMSLAETVGAGKDYGTEEALKTIPGLFGVGVQVEMPESDKVGYDPLKKKKGKRFTWK